MDFGMNRRYIVNPPDAAGMNSFHEDSKGGLARDLSAINAAQFAPQGSIAARNDPLHMGSVFQQQHPDEYNALTAARDSDGGGMSRRDGPAVDTQAWRNQQDANRALISAPSQAQTDYARMKGYDINTGAYSAPQVYNGTQFVNSPQSMQAQLSEFDKLKQQQQQR